MGLYVINHEIHLSLRNVSIFSMQWSVKSSEKSWDHWRGGLEALFELLVGSGSSFLSSS